MLVANTVYYSIYARNICLLLLEILNQRPSCCEGFTRTIPATHFKLWSHVHWSPSFGTVLIDVSNITVFGLLGILLFYHLENIEGFVLSHAGADHHIGYNCLEFRQTRFVWELKLRLCTTTKITVRLTVMIRTQLPHVCSAGCWACDVVVD